MMHIVISALGRQGAWARSGLLKVLASWRAGGDATAADHVFRTAGSENSPGGFL